MIQFQFINIFTKLNNNGIGGNTFSSLIINILLRKPIQTLMVNIQKNFQLLHLKYSQLFF